MVNWSGLPCELLICVVEHIEKLEDFIAFGAVCKGWHTAGKKEYFKGLWLRQGTPYLMIRDRNNNDDTCGFYSLVEDEIVASIRISKFKSKKCHESLGWLLAVDEDGSMCLLNPLSSVEIPVPHQRTFPRYNQFSMEGHGFVQKMVLSARPSETCDFIILVLCGGVGCLAFWRPGDQSWNEIKTLKSGVRDVMYHGGHFYAIGGGCAWVFTLERDNPPMCQIVTRLVDAAKDTDKHDRIFKYYYILKTSQSLFLISRIAPWFNEASHRCCHDTSKFQVYEVDMPAGTWAEIKNIGNMAIFVGHNATFAVDTFRFSGKIKSNRIYFTHDGWEYFYMNEKVLPRTWGEYNIETGTIEMFYPGQVLLSNAYAPIWITPCF